MVVLEEGGMLTTGHNQYLQPDYLSPLPTTVCIVRIFLHLTPKFELAFVFCCCRRRVLQKNQMFFVEKRKNIA